MAAPHENSTPAAGGLQTTVVYQRCVARQLRVLESKIARLELQMIDEMEKMKISTCSESLDEMVTKPRPSSGSSVSGLQKELDRARAKRDKVSQRKNQQEIQGNSAADADGGALLPAADADDGGALPPADGDGGALPPAADGDGGALPPAADDAKSK